MPTAARLFAALGFAAVAFFASEIYKSYMPDGLNVGMLTLVNSIVGFLSGWLVMGRLAGRGYFWATSNGLRTAFVVVFYVLIIWSLYEMLRRSLRKIYDGPMEALKAMTELMSEYVVLGLTDPQVAITLVVGGALAACFAEWGARRFS